MKFLKFLLILTFSTTAFSLNQKEQVADLRKLFNHDNHKAIFAKTGKDCISCHPMSKKLTPEEEARHQRNRVNSCHQCHNGPEEMVEAPKRCVTCHLQVPKDKSHMLTLWKNNHGIAAKQNPKDCTHCHEPQTCNVCHSGQEAMQRDMHPRSFLYSHSISARMNNRTCTTCHQTSYCINCHQKEADK